MKVLHISNDFSLTKVHSNLYKALDDKSVSQIVFNPVRFDTPVGNNTIDFQSNQSSILYSKELKSHHRFLFRSKIDFLYKDLIANIDIKSIDVSHATTLFSDGALAHRIKKKHGIPYIVAVRATDIHVFLKYRPDLVFKAIKILNEAEKIIFIGDSLKKRFLEHKLIRKHANQIELNSAIIYNGIDDFWLDNISPKKEYEPFKILYVGRFISRKNIPKLIESIIALNSKGHNFELNLVGSGGADEALLRDFAKKNDGVINLLGQIKDKSSLRQIYEDNHVFAMPSQGETFGLVYIESLTQGLPLLYLENEGVDGVFSFAIGEKCHNPDTIEISRNLLNIVNNYPNYEIDKIDFSIFRWSNIASKYLHIYKSICEP